MNEIPPPGFLASSFNKPAQHRRPRQRRDFPLGPLGRKLLQLDVRETHRHRSKLLMHLKCVSPNLNPTMGFRFSRHVSIMPGFKLNLSKSGASISAGVRGAHINFGPRGIYGSAGIPGTGLSYRQRLDGATRSYDRPTVERRMSARQVEAQYRRQEQEDKASATQHVIDDEWEHYQHILNFWKPLPEIPSLDNFIQAQEKKPFQSILMP